MDPSVDYERIPELSSSALFSCNFKKSVTELIATLKLRDLTPEEYVKFRTKIIAGLDIYNQEKFPNTSLVTQAQAQQPVQRRPINEQQRQQGKNSRGRPKLNQVRECYQCHTTKTNEWRTGEIPNTFLCNACGLKLLKKKKKEQQMSMMNSSTGQSTFAYTQSSGDLKGYRD